MKKAIRSIATPCEMQRKKSFASPWTLSPLKVEILY
jgi:hypothetical protein